MKKNKMLRIASVLLVAALISTCAISGTFAKYVTKAVGEDSARVAKWGVLVTLDGDVFKSEYDADDETYNPAFDDSESEVTVQSLVVDNLVAPGTTNEGLTATLTGTPEVAVRYTLELSDIVVPVLKAGTYTDYTKLVEKDETGETTEPADPSASPATEPKLGYNGKFEVKEDYYPVVLTLSINGHEFNFSNIEDLAAIFKNNATIGELVTAEFDGEEGAYTGVTLSVDFSPNTKLPNGKVEFGLSWAWAFEQDMDEADTYLGNVAAKVIEDEKAVTDVSFNFVATATQID